MINENTLAADVCAAKMHTHDERFRRDKERLDKLDEIIAHLSESNALLTQMVAGHDKDID